ncbi:response regulator transcription factor [Sphingomonas sp. ID1715]|uniref:response regulator transcription factor n=1 Tax=Sphingomonas sp. ID1715 TaxID=1656898 RepID=UPI0014895C06|nr:response regulator [Sphingomonas sp. ID1715]NNM76700.1 response regulator transcription factor [Sphingomonas sp. ID1715]
MDQSPPAFGIGSEENIPEKIVYVVDDESEVRRSLGFFLKTAGFMPRPFLSGQDFLTEANELAPGCALVDVRMPEISGLELIEELARRHFRLPLIVMTAHGDIATAVRAMKLGAIDFLEKPFEEGVLVEALNRGFDTLTKDAQAERDRRGAMQRLEALTPRERDVLTLLADGKSNKEVAIALDLSVRTVEMHRATMFDRLGVRTLPEALKLAFRARPDLVLPT